MGRVGEIDMLINANKLIHIRTETIKTESNKLVLSQGELRKQNITLMNSHDAMLSYLRGNITTAYQEIGEYVQAKMELLCGIIEGTANNCTSFATEAQKLDEEAGEKVRKGEMIL